MVRIAIDICTDQIFAGPKCGILDFNHGKNKLLDAKIFIRLTFLSLFQIRIFGLIWTQLSLTKMLGVTILKEVGQFFRDSEIIGDGVESIPHTFDQIELYVQKPVWYL